MQKVEVCGVQNQMAWRLARLEWKMKSKGDLAEVLQD